MRKDLISIIVSAYNSERTIKKCIDSILVQTYSFFELIIVDDGSKDNTLKILNEMKLLDNRIQVIHKTNGGLTSARKAGFAIACGEFICFIDSDDYIEKDYLQELYSKMGTGTDIVIGSYYVETGNSTIIKQFNDIYIDKCDFSKRFILPAIYYIKEDDAYQFPDFVWLRLYRKSVITDECFVSERICYTEDLFFQFHALKNASGVTVIDRPIYHYVVTEQSLTQRYRENKIEMLQNRYEMVKDFCVQNNIPVSKERYLGLQYISVLGCIYNARLTNEFLLFKTDCERIHGTFHDFFSNYKKGIIEYDNTKQRLACFFIKMKWYKLLFFLMGV